jgi:hypothetical protein
MTYQSRTGREAFVASSLLLWPVYALGWFLLADRIVPKRLTDAERMQIEFNKNPELKKIHEELMVQYGIGA